MSKSTAAEPTALPRGKRDLSMLLDRSYTYVRAIDWQDAGDNVEVYAVPIADMDPTLRINGQAPDGTWGYIVRLKVMITEKRGTPKERKVQRVRIPRRGFPTEAKAIGWAREKIIALESEPAKFDDTAELGTPEQRERTDRAYIGGVLKGDFNDWERERANLPGLPTR